MVGGIAAAVPWGPVGTLLLTSAGIMGSPGPATVSLVAAGSAFGVRQSLPYLAGIVAGTIVVLLAVATGITAALLAVPALRCSLLGIAAAYILWLAYHIAIAAPISERDETMRASSLAGGALLGVANPKAWVAIAAVFASAHLASAATTDAAAKFLVLTAMIVVINTSWLVAGTSLAPLLRDARHARVVNGTLAAALVGATALAVFH